MKFIFLFCFFIFAFINSGNTQESFAYPSNVLDYKSKEINNRDKISLSFSDQGAWFAYGFLEKSNGKMGFAGPFIMTEQNGAYCSEILSNITITDNSNNQNITPDQLNYKYNSYLSHLEQEYKNEQVQIIQKLFFSSPQSAIIQTMLTNHSDKDFNFSWRILGKSDLDTWNLTEERKGIKITSKETDAIGFISSSPNPTKDIYCKTSEYSFDYLPIIVKPGKSETLYIHHSFLFPQHNFNWIISDVYEASENFDKNLNTRIDEKKKILETLHNKLKPEFKNPRFNKLLAKLVLTLQNNWRSAAGALKHQGLFPSYHYEWFHGFWAWDSWKHATALAQFDTDLAKDQIRAMYDYMEPNGFIPDCIYRDTLIEPHNYRNTKPPLSAWAIYNIYKVDKDIHFLEEMYPKLVKQHNWWYLNRDHDQDGICEYGSTDASIIAAKWESGMDNAVRFDHSLLLKNNDLAWSLNQESVDLNAYLYAEKKYLKIIANILGKKSDSLFYESSAIQLKSKFNQQFYSKEKAWYFDTSIDGTNHIEEIGCEGWIPLWANLADSSIAQQIKEKMLSPMHFNLKIPLQTLSASSPHFNPDNGYWRGPVWLDQSYFGIIGLTNYGFNSEADMLIQKIINNSEGVMKPGSSIRENYHVKSGKGLEAKNFSWSAAHLLLLLLE